MTVINTALQEILASQTVKRETVEALKAEMLEAMASNSEAIAKADEAGALFAKPALTLYRLESGQIDCKWSRAETNGLLIDLFGAKLTPKGKTSKTPNGKGEDIRKRVSRCVDAFDFVQGAFDMPGAKLPKFLEGLNKVDVAACVAKLEGETPERSVFTVYDDIANIEGEEKTKLPDHLNLKKVMAIVGGIEPLESHAAIAADPALIEAYAAMYEALQAMFDPATGDEEGEEERQAA